MEQLRAEGVIDADGRPGPEHARWSVGTFDRIGVDDPGSVILYANRQGGFRVRCPLRGTPIVPAFEAAIAAWRRSGPGTGDPTLVCPACGEIHRLDNVASPPIAFGRYAIVTADASDASLTDEALARVERALGPTRLVLRRG